MNPIKAFWNGATARFFGWWAGLGGFLAMSGPCPCCGGPTCGRGAVLMGLVGAALMAWWRQRQISE